MFVGWLVELREMAETHTVKTVDHAKGAETDNKLSDVEVVPREIVHENADDNKSKTAMQKTSEAVAQGVVKAKEAVVGKSKHSTEGGKDEANVQEALSHEAAGSPIIRD